MMMIFYSSRHSYRPPDVDVVFGRNARTMRRRRLPYHPYLLYTYPPFRAGRARRWTREKLGGAPCAGFSRARLLMAAGRSAASSSPGREPGGGREARAGRGAERRPAEVVLELGGHASASRDRGRVGELGAAGGKREGRKRPAFVLGIDSWRHPEARGPGALREGRGGRVGRRTRWRACCPSSSGSRICSRGTCWSPSGFGTCGGGMGRGRRGARASARSLGRSDGESETVRRHEDCRRRDVFGTRPRGISRARTWRRRSSFRRRPGERARAWRSCRAAPWRWGSAPPGSGSRAIQPASGLFSVEMRGT